MRALVGVRLWLGVWLGAVACGRAEPPAPAVRAGAAEVAEAPWLKVQLHMHTANSGDSATPVAEALRWYAGRGFDAVVVTDHNFVTVTAERVGPLVVAPGVELTQNLAACEPAPEPGLDCLLHVNALFVAPGRAGKFTFPPATSPRREELFARAIAAAEQLGGVAMLNHPNFHYAADAGLLAALAGRGLALFELANTSLDANNEGDAQHPSTEALWDAALGQGARLFAVATDDAHHYFDAAAAEARGETAYTGDRGFVMVQAAREPAAIEAALRRGDFYASTGVVLDALRREAGALAVEAPEGCVIEFVGAGGAVVRTAERRGRIALAEVEGPYVRARVRGPGGRMAWTQPLWRE